EPAVFVEPAHTMALDARHDNEGQPTDEREIHNVYGMLNSRATFEGLARLRPGERPFVLTRATFAGGQRYAAVWPGDNVSDWAHPDPRLPAPAPGVSRRPQDLGAGRRVPLRPRPAGRSGAARGRRRPPRVPPRRRVVRLPSRLALRRPADAPRPGHDGGHPGLR